MNCTVHSYVTRTDGSLCCLHCGEIRSGANQMTQPIESAGYFAPRRHYSNCAVYDPTPSACDCNARGEPYYTAAALEAAKQEGRREGLEEARKLCEDKFVQRWADQLPREASTARSLADALTALIEKDG